MFVRTAEDISEKEKAEIGYYYCAYLLRLLRNVILNLLVNKEKNTKKMQQLDIYYQLLSQHVSGIIMPIFRRTKTVLLHMVYCSGSAGCGW